MATINAQMTIEEIVTKWPQTVGPLTEMGVRCFVCGEPTWGTLQESCEEKGITNLQEILDVLNKVTIQKSDEGE